MNFIHILCFRFPDPLHCFAASFTLTGQTVYWPQIKSFPLDSVVSKLFDLTHRENGSPVCYVLFFYPRCTLAHIPTPIFTVWTCTDCGQQSIWDNGDCQCNVSHLERARERKAANRKDAFSLVVGVEKVISVVMFSCFGNIRFLTERQQTTITKRGRQQTSWWKERERQWDETAGFGWRDLPWHSWQILDCSGTLSPRAERKMPSAYHITVPHKGF